MKDRESDGLDPKDKAESQSNHTETLDEMQDQVEKLEETVQRVAEEQKEISEIVRTMREQHQSKASEKTLSIYFHKLARSVQRELGSKSPVDTTQMQEESAFGEIF